MQTNSSSYTPQSPRQIARAKKSGVRSTLARDLPYFIKSLKKNERLLAQQLLRLVRQ